MSNPGPLSDAGLPRTEAFGQAWKLTLVDRFGIWLSARRIHRTAGSLRGLRVADIGCGYHAPFLRSVLPEVGSALAIDVSLAPVLHSLPKVQAIEGSLPSVLKQVKTGSLDVILSISVLEHLWEPLLALQEFRRVLAPGGICLLNVPTWRGKRFLEYSAFRLKTSPASEMDDHKMYFDLRDLWPLLVRAGFLPHQIHCKTHKFGLNLFAACRLD